MRKLRSSSARHEQQLLRINDQDGFRVGFFVLMILENQHSQVIVNGIEIGLWNIQNFSQAAYKAKTRLIDFPLILTDS